MNELKQKTKNYIIIYILSSVFLCFVIWLSVFYGNTLIEKLGNKQFVGIMWLIIIALSLKPLLIVSDFLSKKIANTIIKYRVDFFKQKVSIKALLQKEALNTSNFKVQSEQVIQQTNCLTSIISEIINLTIFLGLALFLHFYLLIGILVVISTRMLVGNIILKPLKKLETIKTNENKNFITNIKNIINGTYLFMSYNVQNTYLSKKKRCLIKIGK